MRKTNFLVLTTFALLSLFSYGASAQVARTNYTHITTDTTTTIKSGAGVLNVVAVNTAAANETITIYDSPTASGTVIAVITLTATPTPAFILYNINFLNGLTIVTATAAGDITVCWQ